MWGATGWPHRFHGVGRRDEFSIRLGVALVIVVNGILPKHPEDGGIDLVVFLDGRAPAVTLAWVVTGDWGAPDGEAIRGNLVTANRVGIASVGFRDVLDRDGIEVPARD